MSDECVVWWARPVPVAGSERLVGLLDAHERARLDRFRRPVDRDRYLAAHALTRLVLGTAVGAPADALVLDRTCRCGEQHGKPTLPGGPAFSLTHGGDLVGVAVRHGRAVGLDVEPLRDLRDPAAMAAHVCSPAELARSGPPAPTDFFAAWTRKEALLKAAGHGLSQPMAAITLGPDGVEEWTGTGAPGGPVWVHDLLPAPDHPAAVAGLGPPPERVVEADGDAVLRAAR